MSDEELLQKIKEVQSTYYETHNKNWLFKNKQKIDCAKKVSETVSLEDMIRMTIFQIPNTNKVYYNYQLFKTYANPDVIIPLYERFCSVIALVVEMFGDFELHFNLQSFTVSACTRYSGMISSSIDENESFSQKVTKIYIYYTPSVINQIRTILFHSIQRFSQKIVAYSKSESEQLIAELFQHVSS